MTQANPKDPLHGVTLEMILTNLVEQYGWDQLGRIIDIRCFKNHPSIKSSLEFQEEHRGLAPRSRICI